MSQLCVVVGGGMVAHRFVEALPLALARLRCHLGLLFGAHAQNAVLGLRDGWPARAWFRDCRADAPAPVGRCLRRRTLPSPQRCARPRSFYPCSPSAVRRKAFRLARPLASSGKSPTPSVVAEQALSLPKPELSTALSIYPQHCGTGMTSEVWPVPECGWTS